MTHDTNLFKINPRDNVAVVIRQNDGQTENGAVPIGHKIALCDIAKGEKIIKYGTAIGRSTKAIAQGEHVHVHNMETLLSSNSAGNYTMPENFMHVSSDAPLCDIPKTDIPLIDAYKRANGAIGIRNEIWILPLVGCVNKTAEALASWGNQHFMAHNSSIDGVFAFTHPYGCSQMGGDLDATRTILADLAQHGNAGGVLALSLGCENNTLGDFKSLLETQNGGDFSTMNIAFLTTQDVDDEIEAGKKLLQRLAEKAAQAVREPVSAAQLVVGFKCGGSDGFSGISANPLVGRFCDAFTAMGGKAVLTEVPEMFGAEHMLLSRAENRAVFDKTVNLIEDFKQYYISHNQVVYENPSPGNKAGGITTLEDKSCGCVQKGGSAVVRGVYRYGERIASGIAPNSGGLFLLEGPGNDLVSTTALTALGAHIILFTTGRGTPFGAPVPTVKIATNSALAQKKHNWIDFDAGRVFALDEKNEKNAQDAEASAKSANIASIDAEFFSLFTDIVSGRTKTKNECGGYREIAIFKNGVTL
ncbi:MAG: altronate dehydratase family protein [Treponemataceae bacterium]|nr:MAG: altronate dehydratase family protein [Treponemataceae bacterium]